MVTRKIVEDSMEAWAGVIWYMVTVNYFMWEGQKPSPFSLMTIKPLKMPKMEMDEVSTAGTHFNLDQWVDVVPRSVGMEPANLSQLPRCHLITRMITFLETTYNVCNPVTSPTRIPRCYTSLSSTTSLV
ncbi:BREX system Lon protease-like protein BrxL, partial [Salmonella enterica]|uniref:BREX system Lon protease-like protein BrxL n=1 Tax=Salmonella enterica TaxID=28901 RepID=UPI00398C60FD